MTLRVYHIAIIFILVLTAISCVHDPIPPQSPDTIPCSTDTVYFEQTISPLIQNNCVSAGCHNNADTDNGGDLRSYKAIIETGDIQPFDANDSRLVEVITSQDQEEIMPPPPETPLSQVDIETIRLWINQGALNNRCDN